MALEPGGTSATYLYISFPIIFMSTRLFLLFFFNCIAQQLISQSCFSIFTGRDTVIPCTQSCLTLKAQIPDVRSTSDYKVIPYRYHPFPYYIPTGTTVNILVDDVWSPRITLPFTFCFFGTNYNQLVVGSNGLLSFDVTGNTGGCPWEVNNPLPSSGYPRACIMGPFHDMNPADPGRTSPDRSMQYAIVGSAPCRKLIVNFYKIPLYGYNTNSDPSSYCRQLTATHQIVLYEGTGIVDVNIQDKPGCPEWQGGRAIVGIQNDTRTIGITPPNRNATLWGNTGMNESWRFIPNGGNSLFSKVELYNGSILIGTGDTSSLGTGELQATFNNVCTTQDTAAYRVVATYKRCDNPAALITAEDTIQVLRTGGPSITAACIPASCANGGIGTITISSPVGSGYEYAVEGIAYQSAPLFFLPAGTYKVRVRNRQNSCVGSGIVIIPVIESVRFRTSITNATCYGTVTGQVSVITQAGAAPFQFSGNSGTTYQSSNVLRLAAGTHIIRVKDNNNCIKDTTIIITQPDSVSIALPVVKAAYCSGNPDGQIIVSASGGTPSYKYSLTNTVYQNSNILFANVGTFTVYVKDNNGCMDSITGINVPLNDTMRLEPLPDTNICRGSDLIIVPHTNATAFTWSPDTAINNTIQAKPVLSPRDTTIYYLLARLGTLCSRTDTFRVNVLNRPIPDAGPDTTICFGTPAYFHATASRGNKFRWFPAANLSNAAIANPVATGYISLKYMVEVTDTYGCGFREYDTLRLTVRPKVQAYAGQDTTAISGTPVQLSGCCMDFYHWSPSPFFKNDTARNPIGNFPPGTTQVVMITTTPEGCEGRDTILVKGYEGPTYYVPSAFSPGNQDGRNDVFRPTPVGIIETYFFMVFNRSGQLVYTTKTFMAGWDGKWKGELQPEGVYVWTVRGKGIDGRMVDKKGTVVLIR